MSQVQAINFSWLTFNREAAVNGVLVGLQNQLDNNDLSNTGQLFKSTSDKYFDSYYTIIRGKKLWVDDSGTITKVYPEDNTFTTGQTLKMVVGTITTTYGRQQTITRGVAADEEPTAIINSLEARDQFAIQALNTLLEKLQQPESYDDANILHVCNEAYRWAQGMMVAAANAREAVKKKEQEQEGEEEQEQDRITRAVVDTGSGTDTEKLLGNLVSSVDDLTQQMKTNSQNLLSATLKAKVDNTTETQGGQSVTKPFEVSGGGGGGIDYDKLNDVGQNISHITVFNVKAPGRSSLENFTTKFIASLTNTQKQALFDALKAKMDDAYDTKGAAAQALADAKDYTDTEIAKKHPA